MRYYASADIGGTNIKYGIVDETGSVVKHFLADTEAETGGVRLVKKVTGLLADLMEGDPPVSGIGISTAGVVDENAGRVIYANDNLPDYAGTEWKRLLSEKFGLPVNVCNDVHAMGAAEGWVGAGRGCRNYLCVAIGTGIGGCVFLNGKLYTGPHFRASALGYMNTCGAAPRYEQKASTAALVREISAAAGDKDVNGKNTFYRACKGNKIYARVLAEWYSELAKGLANAIFCYDPERIILGGAVSNEGEPLLRAVREHLHVYVPEEFLTKIELKTAFCGNLAGIVGAVRNLVAPD